MATSDRRKAEQLGRRAEWLAAWWLRLKGYRVLARGFRTPLGEIDLVVRRGQVLAFVEVKRRGDELAAAEAIGWKKQQRVKRAAESYLKRHPRLAQLAIRFDALLLVKGRWPRHIPSAWI